VNVKGSFVRACVAAAVTLLGVGCAAGGHVDGDDGYQVHDEAFSSDQATLLMFEFDGELVTNSWGSETSTINEQMLYTIGQLNGSRGVGRLDKLVLTSVTKTAESDGTSKIAYHAVLPVGWGSKSNFPSTYELVLPKRVDSTGLEAFTSKYKSSCVDHGAHDVSSGSMWYYYRPAESGCRIDAEDVVKMTAKVTVSPENTSGKYPEYHKVWEDKALNVVAIFGKYEDGQTTSADAGIAAYNRFARELQKVFPTATVSPAFSGDPGVQYPDVTFSAKLGDGRTVEVVALLVDNVRTAGPAFDARYEDLSGHADIIFYNGHAGLGQNVRALAQKGEFFPGKYQIFFMNGCDTFAYVDGSLAQTRAALNPDDPTGTKYMEIVTNLKPAFFSSMASASLALINGLLAYESPKTYDQIFEDVDDDQLVVVTGEEDNVFQPGGVEPPAGSEWGGFDFRSAVAAGQDVVWETPELEPGTYDIAIVADGQNPGGDADLYVSVGQVPSVSTWDYRPYLDGSDEHVTVTLTARAKLGILVHGYEHMSASTATFRMTARAR
jgi:hypothetical protein